MTEEIWKEILGYEGLYQVSNHGRVKSLGRIVPHKYSGILTIKERILKLRDRNGYWHVNIWKNNVSVNFKVHRLVGFAFIPNPENKPLINHKDGNKKNNYFENLEWTTSFENNKHAVESGLLYHLVGEDLSYSKLTNDIVIAMRKLRNNGATFVDIANKFGVCRRTVRSACIGNTWKHVDYPPVPFKPRKKKTEKDRPVIVEMNEDYCGYISRI